MSDDLQHCSACQEEYVAGVAACVECDGALAPGPLERSAGRTRGAGDAPAAGAPRPDRLLAELPGADADLTVRALLRENITCRVECQGAEKIYAPDHPPDQPFAVTLPVTIYVGGDQLEAAQEILASLQDDDVIGEQWSEHQDSDEGDTEGEVDASVETGSERAPEADADSSGEEPVPETTSFRTVMLIVLAAIVLLFLFGR